MADRDEMVARFVELTQAQPENARAVLESSNWQLEDALNLFYAGPEDITAATSRPSAGRAQDLDEDDFDAPQVIRRSTPPPAGLSSGFGQTLAGGSVGEPPASSEPSGSVQPPRKRGGMMTLGDLGRGPAQAPGDDDDDDDRGQDMFAGGEKSGLAIENPNRQGNRGLDSVRSILKQAQEARQNMPEEDEDVPQRSHFAGRGQTLGSDDVPSQTIEDPNAEAPQHLPKVTRNLYFWRNGFSVEDGPLMRYDDPAHQETLRGIEAGRAPLHLMNVEPGQFTDVNVHRKMDEDYVPPKKKFAPFGGSGQRLGAPTPGFDSTTASSSTSAAPPAASAPAQPAPQTVSVDSSQPSTSLQIRLGDGTRLVSRFNQTHTISDVYAFVNAANTASRSRSYVLQTSFPPKELKEMGQSLKDAGLVNAVVVQKWQ
ncbi:UBX domain-containing protein [Drechslerella dactyloides]|uniref:UBX domain-containing protein n=1 Tax=Drechslerella dactyloides TaxID=74499 RepID=A0AAD6IQF2_DREDA|nr:UBX domain-containing protein [Drechslerella dactyloides]